MPNNMNMHRNIFFKDSAKVPPVPFSALDSVEPWELWKWMDTQRKAGNELLAISHNANLSDGRMYPTDVDIKGRPVDAAWAESRVRNEKLIEIKQLKGIVKEGQWITKFRRSFKNGEMTDDLEIVPAKVGDKADEIEYFSILPTSPP